MKDRHDKGFTDLGLRLSGAALCGASWLAIRTLVHMHLAPWPTSPGFTAFALAATGFVFASVGTAFLTIGRHVFDEIEVGERWRARADATAWSISTSKT